MRRNSFPGRKRPFKRRMRQKRRRKQAHLDTLLDWLALNRSMRFKAKYENEHLTPALSPFCSRKTRRGRDAPSVFLDHATSNSWPQTRAVSKHTEKAR